MRRRTLLGAAGSLAVGSGCLRAPDGGGDVGGSTDDPARPGRVVGRSFADTGRCERPESASVRVDPGRVHVEGCVAGPNGCSVARLGSVRLDGGALSLVVATGSNRPPDTACTEALVYRGYEATVRLDRGVPSSVEVVHATPGGRRTVATWP